MTTSEPEGASRADWGNGAWWAAALFAISYLLRENIPQWWIQLLPWWLVGIFIAYYIRTERAEGFEEGYAMGHEEGLEDGREEGPIRQPSMPL